MSQVRDADYGRGQTCEGQDVRRARGLSRRRRWRSGLGELVALVVAPRSAPLVAVGGVVIDNVPEGGKELAIRLFGTHDKLALQVGTVIVLR